MLTWRHGVLAALLGLALIGCADGTAGDSPQNFLGISQDIGAVFSTQDSYRSPLRPSFLSD
jgi:hypothetical protein